KSESVAMADSFLARGFPPSLSGTSYAGDAGAGPAARTAKILRVYSAHLQRTSHPVDGQHIRRDSIIHLVHFSVAYHFIDGIFHNIQQALVYFTFPPEKALTILHPFEIADRNAARISENIGHGENALGVDNGVGLPGGRTVGAFAKDSCLHLVGVPLGDLIFDGRGDRNVAGLEENVACAHFCPAAREIV